MPPFGEGFAKSASSTVSKLASAATAATTEVAKSGFRYFKGETADRERVRAVHLSFVEWQDGQKPLPFVIFGYDYGWQMWSLGIQGPEEVISRRDGSFRIFSPIPSPRTPDTPEDPLFGARPALALVPAHRNASSYSVQFFSLSRQGIVASLPVDAEILGVQCNDRVILVAVFGQLQAYHSRTLQHIFTSSTSPPISLGMSAETQKEHSSCYKIPFSLGNRWIAYPTAQVLNQNSEAFERASSSASASSSSNNGSRRHGLKAWSTPTRENLTDLAQTLTAAGTSTVRHLSFQYSSWKQRDVVCASQPSIDQTRQSGIVMVRDLCTRTLIAHFMAHSSPIAALSFSPSGRLLATASISGSKVKIFALAAPGVDGCAAVPTLQCTLLRGATPASITAITFSSDAAWIAVGSGRGTVHTFRLPARHLQSTTGIHCCPSGQLVSPAIRIHRESYVPIAPSLSAAFSALQSVYTQTTSTEPLSVGFVPADQVEEYVATQYPMTAEMRLCVVTADGVMRLWSLHSGTEHGDSSGLGSSGQLTSDHHGDGDGAGKKQGEMLCKSVEACGRWDLCRKNTWAEREEALVPSSEQEEERIAVNACDEHTVESESSVWAARCDSKTHACPAVPLVWNSFQFRLPLYEARTGERM